MARGKRKRYTKRKGPVRAKGKVTKTRRVLDYVIQHPRQTRRQVYRRFRRYKRSTVYSILYRAARRSLIRYAKTGTVQPFKGRISKRYGKYLAPKKWYEHFLATKTHSKRRTRGRNRRIDLYALTYAPFSSDERDLTFWLRRAIRNVTGYDADEYAYQGTKEKTGSPKWKDIEVGRIEGSRYEVIDTV